MTLLRWNPKRDSGERQLIAELNSRGITTFPCSAPGLPDIWGIFRGRFLAIEIKSKRGKLTKRQRPFFRTCRNLVAPAYVIRSSEDIEMMMIDLLERG